MGRVLDGKHDGDGREANRGQPSIDDGQIGIGFGLLGAGVGEQDEVGPDPAPPHGDQHGGAVHAGAIRDHEGRPRWVFQRRRREMRRA